MPALRGQSEKSSGGIEDNSEEEDKAEDLSGEESSGKIEDESEEEDKAAIDRINEAKPDFVWIGLGAPKQEKWMAAHQGKIDGLMLGVGAGFDYFAENIKRAPMWMQKSNLEWVYRLMQDPKRLFKRYWSTNTKFIWNAMIRRK